MVSKAVLDSLCQDFNERFGQLSERSIYIKESVNDIRKVLEDKDLSKQQEKDFDDCIWGIMSSASTLGYYIGLQEGAEMIQTLTSPDLPEKLLDVFGELECQKQ